MILQINERREATHPTPKQENARAIKYCVKMLSLLFFFFLFKMEVSLPDHVWCEVFQYYTISPFDISNLKQVSQQFNHILNGANKFKYRLIEHISLYVFLFFLLYLFFFLCLYILYFLFIV